MQLQGSLLALHIAITPSNVIPPPIPIMADNIEVKKAARIKANDSNIVLNLS